MRTNKIFLPLLIGILASLSVLWGIAHASLGNANANVLYVDKDAAGLSTGLSWTDAYTNLQDALTTAISGTQIWVAKGIYYPDEGVGQTNDAITSTFALKDGVAIYGGFVGNESSLDERNWKTNITVLSGDLEQNDVTDSSGVVTTTANLTGTNTYHVVTSQYLNDSAILDGFSITAGYAHSSSPNDRGGGLYNNTSSPTLSNLIFSGNAANNGAGMFNFWYSNPSLINVTFSNNSAGNGGGGLYNHSSSNAALTNVIFSGNSVSNYGGGMYNYNSSPTLTNVIFTGNRAGFYGGGIYNATDSSSQLMNVTISGNSAFFGGGIYNAANSNPVLKNSILWSNSADSGNQIVNANSTPVISYSDIQDSGGSGAGWDTSLGSDGGGNIDADPLFVRNPSPGDGDWSTLEDNDYGDLHLQWGSSAVDTGTNAGCPATDLDGNPRPFGLSCDMGTFELIVWRIFLPVLLKLL